MYLGFLNKDEKSLFLNLAINIASVDNDFSEIEKQIIDEYCKEMNIEPIYESESPSELIIQKVKEIADDRTKKIFVFEIVGLAMIDSSFDENERTWIETMCSEFEISKEFIDRCETKINEYIDIQNDINQLVIEE